jgi:hypothetical protein
MPLSKTFQLYRGGQFQTINTCKFNSIYRKDTYLQWYEFEMHEYGMEHAYNDMSLKWCKLKVV